MFTESEGGTSSYHPNALLWRRAPVLGRSEPRIGGGRRTFRRVDNSRTLLRPGTGALPHYIQDARRTEPLVAFGRLPTPAECAVELDEREELIELGRDERVFGGEEQLLFL